MSHVDPKQPTVMPAYPLGSPPGAETADPKEDPQTAHPLPAPQPATPPAAQPQPAPAQPQRLQPSAGDDEWTVRADADATGHVSRR
jgi:hypothetical protein